MSYVSEKQIKQIAQKISNDYAQKNGTYDDLVSGGSKQLLSDMTINDKAAYNFRTAGGANEIGDRLDDTIVGGTVCWNQLVQNGDFSYGKNNWTVSVATCSVSDGIATVTSTSGAGGLIQNISITTGHKYLVCTNVSLGDVDIIAMVRFNQQDINIPRQEGWQSIREIIVGDNTKNQSIYFRLQNGGNTLYVGKTNLFDLTQMFGTAVADHIYSLEQSTAGVGVAWFKRYFPKEYYDYSAPTLASVSVASHDNTGFNAYNPTTSIAKLVGGMEYQITGTYTSLSYSSGETIAPDSDGYFTPSVSGELSVVGGNDSDTCVHLVWDGEKDGEWEPYKLYSYPLDKKLTLRGIPKLDANNKLYYNGDIYESDGTVTRRYDIVDMGTLNWRKATMSGTGTVYYHVPFTVCKSSTINMITPKYTTIWTGNLTTQPDKSIWRRYGASNGINIRDDAYAESSEADFKASLSGVYLVYELQTPTTESAAPFTNPQTVDDFGTESYINPRIIAPEFSTELTYEVGDFVTYSGDCYRCITAITEAGEWDSTKWIIDNLVVEVPVGHDTEYYPNMRAKLEMVPDSPDGESGNYVVNHTKESGENKYIPFGTAIQNDAGLNNELNRKANIDGYYETLTAGSSEQLLSTVQIEDKVPYNFRTSGGSADIGNRLTDKIVGGTICWNQLVNHGNFDSSSGWSASGGSLSVADGVATFTASATEGRFGRSISLIKDHKYIISAQVKTTTETDKICLHTANSALSGTYTVPSTDWQTIQKMYIRSGNTQDVNVGIKDYRGSDWDAVQVRNFVVYDLTAMFGSTIADYIYSLGHTAGIAWFKSLFPKDYYAYNAREMLSVNVSSHDTVGFNAFDKNSPEITVGKFLNEDGSIGSTTTIANYTGYIKVLPDTRYQFTDASNSTVNRYICWYDAEKNFISSFRDSPSVNVISPPNAYYVRASFDNTKRDAFCINLSWDGEKDGEFEEYIKHSYPLDSSLTLRGVPMLDANNKLYYDGDIYESDGTVTRRYRLLNLGTINWTYYTDGTNPIFVSSSTLPGLLNESFAGRHFYNCDKYITLPDQNRSTMAGSNGINKSFAISTSGTRGLGMVRDDSYTDATTFKAAVNGIYVVYAVPEASYTTETAAPYQNPQIIDDFGTEEYVDYAYSQGTRDVAIPVGHDTLYMNNLRAKLEMSPDSPDGDGDYIVRQSGGENVYVPLTKELPAAPSEDGNYVLKVTVVNGAPTYSWEAQA